MDGYEKQLLEQLDPVRVRMPDDRVSRTHKFTILEADKVYEPDEAGELQIVHKDIEGYITAGVFPTGKLGEVFLTIGKSGGPWKIADALMTSISIGLQYGIPLQVYLDKFQYQRFEPAGWTKNPEIPQAKSILDYVFQWLDLRFPGGVDKQLADKDEGVENELSRFSGEDEGGEGDAGGGEAVPLCKDDKGGQGDPSDAAGGSV